jgi:hypothetical protein
MNNNYSASEVPSRDTLAIRTFMDAYNNGLRDVSNRDWAFCFVERNGTYQIVVGTREKTGNRYWIQPVTNSSAVPMPEGKTIDNVMEWELRFIEQQHGLVNVFIGNRLVKDVPPAILKKA